MQARQITTYAVHSRAITEETVLPVTLEADEPRHLESGVINLYPDIRYQEIEGFGGALTDTVGYLYSKMTPECKRQFLEAYFGETASITVSCGCILTAAITPWMNIRPWPTPWRIRTSPLSPWRGTENTCCPC